MFVAQEILRKKRDGAELSKPEIEFMVLGNVSGQIPDYQLSALLMSIFFRGLSERETKDLLEVMISSGERYTWNTQDGKKIFVDKHSTGGVGDKTSLVILPLLICDGFHVPMICGRGLGHTGGTVDKLESIPGFNCTPNFDTFQMWMTKCNGAFSAQSDSLVPADKKLYALRDVTATVENVGLITASILSKKLAEGVSGLSLDVKFGSGAFMQKAEDAEHLAKEMIKVANAAGCKTIAALTNMSEPLGRSAGNALEVAECLDVLGGAGPRDTRELSLQLAAAAAAAGKNEADEAGLRAAYSRMRDHLDSGRAYETFLRVAVNQGAKLEDLERRNTSWIQGHTRTLRLFAQSEGFVSCIDTREVGLAIVELGGGRRKKEDAINPFTGLTELKKIGELVNKDEPLCTIHLAPENDESAVKNRLLNAFKISPNSEDCKEEALIKKWLF